MYSRILDRLMDEDAFFRKMELEILGWMGIASAVMFVGSILAIPFLVARIPTDYFIEKKEAPRQHPVLALLFAIFKNTLGIVLILAGLAMLVLPGQGLLTLLIGLMLTSFPGKHALILRIVQRPAILNALNRMRAKANRPPLDMPEHIREDEPIVKSG